jgi:hypothetical protein
MDDKRVYLVVSKHGTVMAASLEAGHAFNRLDVIKKETGSNLFEVKSYKLEGEENG